ncbi:protein of unknown function [Lentzea fradiae]|uniref:DUF397 domain-containing protein n=1 Tax=Lentzea fradiae TaxID=200378 RepID=A0A1G7SMK3_9PSEU|nr:DUF397 domain-containing protein [Lentzea fradiae]SDG24327.1 protein of unknown function [Lentzea fradiae]
MAPGRIWRKSSYSTANGSGDCVEVSVARVVLVRDTKNASGGRLAFSPPAWRALLNWL